MTSTDYLPYDPEATETKEEAHALLKKVRRQHIEAARSIADEIIALNGETNGKEVLSIMEDLGMIDPKVRNHWLGAVFSGARHRYVWTGKYTNGTNVKAHTARDDVKVWTWVK